MPRAIFLDRDGVICENRADYVKSWQEFEFLPGVKESLAALSHLGLPIVVVTNQAAVGRGLLTSETLEDIHQRMVAEIAAYGGRIDGFFGSESSSRSDHTRIRNRANSDWTPGRVRLFFESRKSQ